MAEKKRTRNVNFHRDDMPTIAKAIHEYKTTPKTQKVCAAEFGVPFKVFSYYYLHGFKGNKNFDEVFTNTTNNVTEKPKKVQKKAPVQQPIKPLKDQPVQITIIPNSSEEPPSGKNGGSAQSQQPPKELHPPSDFRVSDNKTNKIQSENHHEHIETYKGLPMTRNKKGVATVDIDKLVEMAMRK